MADFLLEIFSEEIPARAQPQAEVQLARLVMEALAKHHLSYTHLETASTPRRLVVSVKGLPLTQDSRTVELKGPKVSATSAIDGFLASHHLKRSDCMEKNVGKDTYLFATKTLPGQKTEAVLGVLLSHILHTIEWPKTMRWGARDFAWARPIRRLLALFDGSVLPFTFEPLGLHAEGATMGHRFLSPHRLDVTSFTDYKDKLYDNYVMVRAEDRRARIVAQIQELLAPKKLHLKPDDALIDELTYLVEWPVTLLGTIDEAFMSLPPEVLVTSMRHHQKFLSVTHADGALAPYFLVVSNMETADQNGHILEGNERVLRARLSDAQFFFDQDRKRDLSAWNDSLKQRLFHIELGTVHDKVTRLAALADRLAFVFPQVPDHERQTAARLLKADLSTAMVGEFPELQGVMGHYYARHSGHSTTIANAIRDHYAPLGLSDTCPTAPLSVLMALVDKLDTLVGFFSINQLPTSSKDPYGLRRTALGIIRLMIDHAVEVPLPSLVEHAILSYGITTETEKTLLLEKIMGFIKERFKFFMKNDFPALHIQAVLKDSETPWIGHLSKDVALLKALKEHMDTSEGQALVDLYKRVANILDGAPTSPACVDATLLTPPETALFKALEKVEEAVHPLLAKNHVPYPEILGHFLTLRAPLATFFDHVLVNAEDEALRKNRLSLLRRIHTLLQKGVDLSGF